MIWDGWEAFNFNLFRSTFFLQTHAHNQLHWRGPTLWGKLRLLLGSGVAWGAGGVLLRGQLSGASAQLVATAGMGDERLGCLRHGHFMGFSWLNQYEPIYIWAIYWENIIWYNMDVANMVYNPSIWLLYGIPVYRILYPLVWRYLWLGYFMAYTTNNCLLCWPRINKAPVSLRMLIGGSIL